MTLQAFLNSQELKDKITARLQEHYALDEIVQGCYWENGKGCLWGCALHSKNPHSVVEDQLGIPRIISQLSDRIFEGLPNAEAKEFPLTLQNAIAIGADLSNVWIKFVIWILGEVEIFSGSTFSPVNTVKLLYVKQLNGEVVSESEWRSAADAAADASADAAADATYAAADASADATYAYAAYAAYADAAYATYAAYADAYAAAAYAAAAYTAAAAYAAVAAVAYGRTHTYDDARQRKYEFYRKMRDKLIELIASSV